MATIRQQFVMGKGLASNIINYFGAGINLGFSHVDCVLPNGDLFGARSDAIGGKPPGVQRRPADYQDGMLIRREIFSLNATPKQAKAYYDFLLAQEGKPYDKVAILGFVGDRDWRDDSAWFCDELAAAATEKGSLCEVLYLPVNKLTPTSWALVLSAIGAGHAAAPV